MNNDFEMLKIEEVEYNGAYVQKGQWLTIIGIVNGQITVDFGARLTVRGISNGNIVNNGNVVVYGTVDATIHNHGTCEIYGRVKALTGDECLIHKNAVVANVTY